MPRSYSCSSVFGGHCSAERGTRSVPTHRSGRGRESRLYNSGMPLPSKLLKAIDAILNSPGATELQLRRALLERTRSGAGHVPGDLREFVDKIAERPWTITDDDFIRLRAAGYSEDQLYELTLAAALCAGLLRSDAGLRALEEAP